MVTPSMATSCSSLLLGSSGNYVPHTVTTSREMVTMHGTYFPGTHLVFGQCSFTVAGPSVSKSLPPHVRNSPTNPTFCSKLKIYFSVGRFQHIEFCNEGFIKLTCHNKVSKVSTESNRSANFATNGIM